MTDRLNPELAAYLETADFPMLRHPLVYAVPFFDTPDMVARLNRQLEQKRMACNKAMADKEYERFIFLHERAYRLQAFQEVCESMGDAQYWATLRDIWVDSENIFQNAVEWWEMISTPRAKRALFTACEDRSTLKKLPAELTIYRGTKHIEADGHYLGFSWTIDEAKANWFATRFVQAEDGPPIVFMAKVRKKHIVGYIGARGEQEIVVEPRNLVGLTWEQVE